MTCVFPQTFFSGAIDALAGFQKLLQGFIGGNV
jgi:hypothetical protein